jgi:two-component system, sensor histidine kinase and response regulator
MKLEFSIRHSLPIGLMLAVASLLGLSHWSAITNDRAALLQQARTALMTEAEHLARAAQIDLKAHPDNLAADLSVAATNRRTQSIALVNAGGMVEMASQRVWHTRPAAEVIQGFSTKRFQRVVQGRLPDIEVSEDGLHLTVMTPFYESGNLQTVRNLEQGVAFLAHDLSYDMALLDWNAQRRLVPQLLVALGLTLVLAWLLRRHLSRPLALLEEASLKMAQDDDLTLTVPELGPREVVELARSFNALTQRVQTARQALARSQSRMVGIFESAMDAIITVSPSEKILSVNAAALKMFRCTEEQVIGQPIEMLMPSRFRPAHSAHMQGYISSGVTRRRMGLRATIYGRRLDGEEFPAEASISHMKIEGEQMLTVILHDVTDRKRAEDEVKALNSQLEAQVKQRTASLQVALSTLEQQQQSLHLAHEEQRTIFDTVTVGIVLTKHRQIFRSNRKMSELFGYVPGELDGQLTQLWFPDDASFEAASQTIDEKVRQGVTHVTEQMLVRRDGSQFWARISTMPYPHGYDGQAILGIVEDMTLQRQAAHAMLQAQQKAEEASQAKSSFLANMSHEIRTPMNAIIGMAYLVLKTELTPRQNDYIRKIQGSSQHLMGIINDILDYSKIEAGKLDIEHIEFDLERVLDNLASLMGDKATAKGLELIINVDKNVPLRLIGDPLRLGQILINYANNAVKFTATGQIEIQVRVREETATDLLLYCAVRDTGIGLTEDQIPQLFQSFQQADSSTTREFGGSGLGLAISRQLAELMHGDVGVSSEHGRGSTFWFTARIEKSAAQPRARILHSEVYGKRVLVVDDNESARLVLKDMLDDLHLLATPVDSGAQALEVLYQADVSGAPFEIAFLDWQMPMMDGIELAGRIRSLQLSVQPGIVLVTGYGREEVLKSADSAHIHHVLVKPVNASMLFDCVARQISNSTHPEQARAAPLVKTADTTLAAIKGARILLVEDNELNQHVASELLRDAGLVVDVAQNGLVALAQVQREAYDCVLMDMQMPVMDGLSATRAMRRLPSLAQLPILAMTANASPTDRQACLEAGMNDHVPKPINPQDVFQHLLQWIEPMQRQAAPPRTPLLAEPDAELPEIPGLDLVKGLRQVMGKRALYWSMLDKFAAGQHKAIERIQQALQANDWDTAERHAHTLKGVAANIGMGPIQHAAADLEKALHQRQDHATVEALLEAVARHLDPFIATLAPHLQAAQAGITPGEGSPSNASEVAQVCAKLVSLLIDNDMEAADLLQQHAAGLSAALGTAFAELETALGAYDFETSLQCLRQAMQTMGIPPVPPESYV